MTTSGSPMIPLLIGGLLGMGLSAGYSYFTGKPSKKPKPKTKPETIYDKEILTASVKKITKSDELMIYGFDHCKYMKVAILLEDEPSPFKILIHSSKETSAGELEQLPYTPDYSLIGGGCKAQLVNLVYENYKREKMKMEIIPVLFFIDIEGNKFPLKAEDVASKDPKFNSKFTFKEARRLYKICEFRKNSGFSAEELEKDKELRDACKAVERIGKKMCIPVRLNADSTITVLPFFWEDKGFPSSWETRMKTPTPTYSKKISWRKELVKKIVEFDQSKKT